MTKIGLKLTSLITAAFLIISIAATGTLIYLKQLNFEEHKPLDSWGIMVLKGKVDYRLIREADNGYVYAVSNKSCSALYYKLEYKLDDYPNLGWKWRVLKFPDRSRAKTEKDKDDYAARVYIIFPHLCFTTSRFLEYVWDEHLPVGTMMKSPYGDNVRIIVARSGKSEDTNWASEERNAYEDYIAAFGEKPVKDVGAVAIMCDADSSKTQAEAQFDDITIGNKQGI